MSKKDSKILFLDDDGQEIEFNVIEGSSWKCWTVP